MELYLLINTTNKNVVAMSQDINYIYRYIKQNNFNKNTYVIDTITKKKKIYNKLLLYEDSLLEECEGYILTNKESSYINSIFEEDKYNLLNIVTQLSVFTKEYNFTNKEKHILKKAIKILKYNSKPKRINTLMNVKESILTLFKFSRNSIIDHFTEFKNIIERL